MIQTHHTHTPTVHANDLPAGFDNRELTLQIETESIGITYEKGVLLAEVKQMMAYQILA